MATTRLEIPYEIRKHAEFQKDLVLSMDDAAGKVFRGLLDSIRAESREALVILPKLTLPDGVSQRWETYWKQRDAEDSRAMVAHPERDLWVATLALSASAIEGIARSLDLGETVRLESFGPMHAFNNLHVTFEFRK